MRATNAAIWNRRRSDLLCLLHGSGLLRRCFEAYAAWTCKCPSSRFAQLQRRRLCGWAVSCRAERVMHEARRPPPTPQILTPGSLHIHCSEPWQGSVYEVRLGCWASFSAPGTGLSAEGRDDVSSPWRQSPVCRFYAWQTTPASSTPGAARWTPTTYSEAARRSLRTSAFGSISRDSGGCWREVLKGGDATDLAVCSRWHEMQPAPWASMTGDLQSREGCRRKRKISSKLCLVGRRSSCLFLVFPTSHTLCQTW